MVIVNVGAPEYETPDFTVSEAAGFLGVSINTIRRWADSGALQCYRTPGGQRRFTEAQLRAVLTREDHRA